MYLDVGHGLLRFARNDRQPPLVIARNEVTWQSTTQGKAPYLDLTLDYFAVLAMTAATSSLSDLIR